MKTMQTNDQKPYDPETRARLVREAAEKPVRRVVQLDYFDDAGEQYSSVTEELRGIRSIRLQLPVGTPKGAALKALDGFRKRITKDPTILGQPQPPTPPWLDEVLHETAPVVLRLACPPQHFTTQEDVPF